MKNNNLAEAKRNKNDEFYTQWSDIEKEIVNYKPHFRDKVVYLNCDDPEESNFWKFFAHEFNELGLRGLISTHYDDVGPTYMLELTRNDINAYLNTDGSFNPEVLVRHPLEGNGDFRNAESIALLRRSDIVCTNPPFSLFREYVAQLMEYEKKFLIVATQNALTYKEIFPLVRDNRIWLGVNSIKEFMIPGGEIRKFGNIMWFTNLTHRKHNQLLGLYAKQSEKNFPKYDNYDAINIDKVIDIPYDYNGVMGVPITFIDKFNPEQFEILGSMASTTVDDNSKGYPFIDGERIYARILIKHKLIYDQNGIVVGRRETNENRTTEN